MNKEAVIEQIIKLLQGANAADCAIVLEFVQHLTRP